MVPRSFKVKGVALGIWVGNQRNAKDQLSAERVERLNGIGFVWDPHKKAWDKAFKLLTEYKDEFGDCQVRKRYKANGFALGIWVGNQRTAKDQLSAERVERLNGIGFVWLAKNETN